MRTYKSSRGKVVDLGALIAKNETVRAVGNMKVNARGDTIDSQGRIVAPASQKVNEYYSKTVVNKAAQPNYRQTRKVNNSPNAQKATPDNRQVPTIDQSQLTVEEREIEDSFEDDLEIEQIKAQESKK